MHSLRIIFRRWLHQFMNGGSLMYDSWRYFHVKSKIIVDWFLQIIRCHVIVKFNTAVPAIRTYIPDSYFWRKHNAWIIRLIFFIVAEKVNHPVWEKTWKTALYFCNCIITAESEICPGHQLIILIHQRNEGKLIMEMIVVVFIYDFSHPWWWMIIVMKGLDACHFCDPLIGVHL